MSQHRPLFLAPALSRALLLLIALALLIPLASTAQVVDLLPRISAQPQSATIGRGANVRFSVGVVFSSGGPVTYQWYEGNTLLPGKTASTLDRSNVQNGATYYVRLRNNYGSRNSNIVSLTVVQGGLAPLGGRPMLLSTVAQQPSVAVCGAPHVAWINTNSAGVGLLTVSRFDGYVWRQVGGVLNVSTSSSATEPSLDCFAGRPAVAWSESAATGRNIHVAAWSGTQWVRLAGSAQRPELNETAGTTSIKPVLRVHPQGAGSGGIADHSAVAWIEQWYVRVKYWNGSAWVAYPGGGGPGVGVAVPEAARDVALTFVEPTRTEPVVAWIQPLMDGVIGVYTAFNRNGWLRPSQATYAGVTSSVYRVGVGVEKFEQLKAPVTVWTEGAPNARLYARKLDPAEFATPTPFNPNAWTEFAPSYNVGAMTAFAFAPQAFSGPPCGFAGGFPALSVLSGNSGGFIVKQSVCPNGTPAWMPLHAMHPVALESGSLAMTDESTPIVAGVEMAGTQHQLSVWRFYP
ncbi:MAG: immunoglobulin domain-containing protein [Burkholderiales bacterium]